MYKFNHEINIFIYDLTKNSYKGIIFKNNNEYLTFEDIIIRDTQSEYDLIRKLGKNQVFIKNEIVHHIKTTIKNMAVKKTQPPEI